MGPRALLSRGACSAERFVDSFASQIDGRPVRQFSQLPLYTDKQVIT